MGHFLGAGLLELNFDHLVWATALLRDEVSDCLDQADLVVKTRWTHDLWMHALGRLS